MNRKAVYWAAGCAVLGVIMLVLGIRAAVAYRAPSLNQTQVLTLGQFVDLVVGGLLIIVAALTVVGQVRAHRRRSRHRRWVREHLGSDG